MKDQKVRKFSPMKGLLEGVCLTDPLHQTRGPLEGVNRLALSISILLAERTRDPSHEHDEISGHVGESYMTSGCGGDPGPESSLPMIASKSWGSWTNSCKEMNSGSSPDELGSRFPVKPSDENTAWLSH